jgi:endonuclease I
LKIKTLNLSSILQEILSLTKAVLKNFDMKKLFTILLGFTSIVINAQTTLPTSWNFSNPGISTPPVGWTMNLGTNGNLTYAFGIGDALSARLDATNENFVINFSDKPGSLSYYLSPQNAGNAWGGQFDIQESTNGTSWTTIRSITSKATTTTSFTGGKYTDVLQASSRFVRFYYTTKLPGGSATAPGGNMAVDSVLIRKGVASEATINVKRGTVSLVSNATSVIGKTSTSSFFIENNGSTDTLKIDSIRFVGDAMADFSISDTINFVAPSSSKPFTLNFSTIQAGTRLANLEIYSNDALKNPFVVKLYAIGGNYASEPTALASNIQFTDIKSFAYKMNFQAASPAPERYLVLKRKDSAVVQAPIDGITYQKGDYIGSAQVAFISDSPNVYSPNYVIANTTYYYAIYSFNGPLGFENYTANATTASVVSGNNTPGNYYNSINPNQSNFVTSLSQKINPHDTIFYSQYISKVVDYWLARDTSAGKEVVNCVYSGAPFIYNDPFLWAAGANGATLTREHTFPQSWMPSNGGRPDWPNAPGTTKELPEYNDLHHLYPTHQVNANVRRSNHPYGNVKNATYTAPTGFGKVGTDSLDKTVYEPRPDQRGDAARALMYMSVCYHGVGGQNWSLPSNQDQNVLKQWNEIDPPDNFEIARNEMIFSVQGNRNPFVDNPSWVNAINFSNMSWISNQPLSPEVNLIKPDVNSVWKKGASIQLQWTAKDFDSLQVYMSVDSGLTYTLLPNRLSVKSGSAIIQPLLIPVKRSGRIIVKSTTGSTADTSDYFKILIPELSLIKPNASSSWKIGNNLEVSWVSIDLDSIELKMSVDSGNSFTKVSSNYYAGMPNITFIPNLIPSSSYGKFIIKSLVDFNLADTSEFFNLEIPIGLVDNNRNELGLNLYPNPLGNDNLFIEGLLIGSTISMYDLFGREVYKTKVTESNEISLQFLTKGIYIIDVNFEEKRSIFKLVKD